MKKTYHCISGLPRTGSTLLCNVLAQNPRFRCDGVTSGVLDIVGTVRDFWDKIPEFNTYKNPEAKKRCMAGLINSYYADSDHQVVIDKSRGWAAHIELLDYISDQKTLTIVPVRDMRAVAASWEKMFRRTKGRHSANLPPQVQSVMDRVQFWLSATEPTGRAYNAIQDALTRGLGERMLFVDFDKFCHHPAEQMQRIYQFLGEDSFPHDFDNVEQKHLEEDEFPWMEGLHVVRRKVEPIQPDYHKILGNPVCEQVRPLNELWKGRI